MKAQNWVHRHVLCFSSEQLTEPRGGSRATAETEQVPMDNGFPWKGMTMSHTFTTIF